MNAENDAYVLTTDPEGKILYCSQGMQHLTGYNPAELQGENIRKLKHPDMPDGPFKDLWGTITQGKSWMGMIKNKMKNGETFWVDTYIIPIMENGKIIEYQCIYRKPKHEVVDRADHIYTLRKQGKSPKALSKPNPRITLRILAIFLLSFVPVIAAVFMQLPTLFLLSIIGASLLLGCLLLLRQTKALENVIKESRKFVNHQVKQLIYTGTTNDIGQLLLTQTMLQSQLDAILRRISAASNEVQTSASESTEVMSSTCQEAEEQQRSLQQLAAAMSQVSSATSSVAQTTAEALQQVHQVQHEANHGGAIVDSAVNDMSSLDEAIDQIDHNIDNLKQSSEKIGKVVVVISDIAEQTNLLALNAAIEAARAGENGRGFAVVADEVRQLAQRTQNSTQEINDIITGLQQEITQISSSMVNGRKLTDTSVASIQQAGSSLQEILNAVAELSNMTAQIASATEEQNAVAVEMNEQIFTIQRNSENVVSQASQTLNLNKKSEDLARKQSQMIERVLTC